MSKSYVKYFLALLITLSFLSCESNILLISPPENDTKPVWPQVGYNGRHTGNRYGININIPPVQNGDVYWMDSTTHSWVNDGSESACDANGNFYFRFSTAAGGKIIKYRPDGTRIWVRDSLQNDCYTGIALSNDETKLYYSDWYKFTCLDSSGNLVWSIANGSNWGTIPCVAKDGTIYTSFGFNLTAVSPDGNVKWRLFNTNVGTCWPVLDRDDNIIVQNTITTGQYELLKINRDGNVIYRYKLSDWIFSAVIDGFNNIYFRYSDSLISLNENFDTRWKRAIPGFDYAHVVPAITKENHIIIDSGYVAVMSIDGQGKTDWINLFPNSGFIEPYIVLDDEDNIYFNHLHDIFKLAVSSFDKNGNLRWQNIDPAIGWVLPGLTLSPLGMLFDTPKRPNVVFTIK